MIQAEREAIKRQRMIQNEITSYAFLLPWLVFLFLFTIYPFLYGIGISFFDFKIKSNTFVGLENYVKLIFDDQFLNAVVVTLKLLAIIVPGTIIIALSTAYAIHELHKNAKVFVKIVYYLTTIVSQIALVIVWKWMFNSVNGLFTTGLQALGLPIVDWFSDTRISIPLIGILVMSFTLAQPLVIYSAAMDGVPKVYYEAADVDGASRPSKFFHITLPSIAPVLVFTLVTTTINNFQVFVVPYLMTGGGPNYKTTPIMLLVYRSAFEYGDFGLASAMGVTLFMMIGVLVAMQFRMTRAKESS